MKIRQIKTCQMKICTGIVVFILLASSMSWGESFRAMVAGTHTVSLEERESTAPLTYASSTVILLDGDTRFFRGIELELISPQNFLACRGSLAAALYGDLNVIPQAGTADLNGRRLAFDPIPAKIQTVYQIPLKNSQGFRTTPYATVLTDAVQPSSFPLLFRLMPVIKGISEELERMIFYLNVKPILSDEGALKISFRFPGNVQDKPFSVLIDDELIANPGEERFLKEGEHHLVILSENYRNQSSRFVIERAKILDLSVDLLDIAPLLIFEYPEKTRIYLNNVYIPDTKTPLTVEPGIHEVRFEVSDYTITRLLTVQKGKTYRIALSVDVNISETD